jgi:hypothetical protein
LEWLVIIRKVESQ